MSLSDLISLIGKTNKISIVFFAITCILLGYELYLYLKDKKGTKKPNIPVFKKGVNEPLSTHTPKPVPAPPTHPTAAPHTAAAAPIPPLISQMSPPNMKHMPPTLKKKKKMSRGAKVTIGATAALMVLTVGIAWKLNQPASQQAVNTTTTRADEATVTAISPTPTTGFLRTLIPTITPRPNIVDLSSPTTTPSDFDSITTQTASPSAEPTESVGTTSSELSQLPVTGGTESATLAPTLPIAGTIQYSIGLLMVASVIVIASLIF